MNASASPHEQHLGRSIGSLGFFTLAFGAIVGSGWVLVLGEWLARGGPGGAAVGFLAGGVGMMAVGLCYAELSARMPVAGGEFLYARECVGPRTAFVVGWFLTLKLIAVCAFEGIALSVLVRDLVPAMNGTQVYMLFGEPVTTGALAIGLCGAVMIGYINVRGASTAIAFQNIVTFTFIGVMLAAIILAFVFGKSQNLAPLFPSTAEISWIQGSIWVFSLSGMFLNGFQSAVHAIEERRQGTPLRRSVLSMVFGIGAAACFYGLIVLSAASAVPWKTLINAPLPAAFAFQQILPGGLLSTVVMLAAILSLVKTWNASAFMASRLLFAQARFSYLPAVFAQLSRTHRVPLVSILTVTFFTLLFIPLGRGAVVPIVNMCSMCLAVTYVLCTSILLRLRSRQQSTDAVPAFTVPGGRILIWFALITAVLMASTAIIGPAIRTATVPLEWILISAWGLCGFVAWFVVNRRLAGVACQPQR